MISLKAKQSALKGQLTIITNQLDAHGTVPLSAPRYKTIKEKLDEYLEKSISLNEEIFVAAADSAEQATQIAEHEAVYLKILDLIDRLIAIPDPGGPSASNARVSAADTGIRLPKVEIPSFSGDLQEWVSFHDLFASIIHNNAKLSNSAKLQYLKSSLKGAAANVIQSFQITDDNYQEAWKLLNERYNNKREIVHAHLKRLFGQPSIKEESAYGLRRLIDTTNECMRALKVLNRPVDTWDDMVVYLVTERLDPESRRQWLISLQDDTPPDFADLIKFLDQRARALSEAGETSKAKHIPNVKADLKPTMSHHVATENCMACKDSHQLFRCSTFAKMSVSERRELVKKNHLCYKCFGFKHSAAQCNKWPCKKCNGNHHSLLHFDEAEKEKEKNHSTQAVKSLLTSDHTGNEIGLLATAIVNVIDRNGIAQSCRALLDNGSEASLITEDCVQRLGLRRQQVYSSIEGVSGSQVGVAKSAVQLNIRSMVDTHYSTHLNALVLPTVTRPLPSQQYDPSKWHHLKKLQLADPGFFQPGKIDLLLSVVIFTEILGAGRRHGRKGQPIALQTALGWIVSGSAEQIDPRPITVNHVQCTLDETLHRFWELEEIPSTNHFTSEEIRSEEHFVETHSRDETGRFVVCLPFRDSNPLLGSSREMAFRRLKQVEGRMSKSPELLHHYVDFMKKYEELGHMQAIPKEFLDCPQEKSCYIPHHAVMKDPSMGNKFRVVFDASAKTSNGSSLNDLLMVGPTLQDDIVSLLIRFRFHIIGILADVCKMYRQILVHRDYWDFQRILWRNDPKKPVKEYWLKTVTYGTGSAPYQATKCLQQLAQEERDSFPLASATWLADSYVDDLMTGAKNESEAIELCDQLNQMMSKGKFELRKFSSNNTATLQHIPSEMRETDLPLDLDSEKTVKTLGVIWHPARDEFSFSVNLPQASPVVTKRVILSEMSQVFDPLGWISPVTVRAKILFQQLWKLKVGWDEQLPSPIQAKWLEYRNDLYNIQSIRLPRRITPDCPSHLQLLGFCDSSEQAYSAVVYLRCIDEAGVPVVNLIAAKTKVTPIKKISLPRLELCGAVLLVRLIQMIRKALRVDIENIFGWSDSTVVLDWLASRSDRWKTFVANRVSEVQEIIPITLWHHVPGKENPADCASRGISPSELISHPLWWKGPSWISLPNIPMKSWRSQNTEVALSEERKLVTTMTAVIKENSLLKRFSSLNRLQRITAICQRFLWNTKCSPKDRRIGPLRLEELTKALNVWIRYAQDCEFGQELSSIRTKNSILPRSKLASLSPFIDEDGILRVGGRLRLGKIPMDKKFPILLPRCHTLTQLIVTQEHQRLLHAGPQLLLASLQQRYWILHGRDVVRHMVKRCVICVKQRAETVQQMMGNLPALRINQSRAFLTTGVDYAGPFHMRVLKGRGHKQFKAYLALFVCFVTRAIHLEAVSDMTTGAFLAALQRFVSRRGRCRDLFSDCGSNFIGASKELKSAMKITMTQDYNDTIVKYMFAEGMNWHFNPPSAPHQGGLWEAGVKSVKFHLRRIVGNQVLNFEEFSTMLAQVEACLNSRPLCPASSDPNDLVALTPGHFLIGAPLTAIPEPSLLQLKDNHLSRWQLVQKLSQQFWHRWSTEYLSRLQQRPKWWAYHPNLKIGDLVLVKDDHLPPLSWPLGRVIKIHPGADDKVRVVTIKTAKSEIKRPVVKLCHLPIESADQDNCE